MDKPKKKKIRPERYIEEGTQYKENKKHNKAKKNLNEEILCDEVY